MTDEICDRSCDYLHKFRGSSNPKNSAEGSLQSPFSPFSKTKKEPHIGLHLKSVISRPCNGLDPETRKNEA